MSLRLTSPLPSSGRGHGVSRESFIRSVRLLTPSLARAACGGLPPNRRGEIRRALRFGCRVRRTDNLRIVGDRAVDLSPKGMLLLSDERLGCGTDLQVSFMSTDFPIWFDTQATMVRVVEGRRPGDSGRALGIRFDSLPSVARLILRGHLQRVPPTTPQREVPLDLRQKRDPDYGRIVQDIFEGRG
ncbi:MAG TPA: PilZ domain-containing protein [Polyangiaceae bacterium]|nr:PilZ domain-containing protein [Polyangiaceae bacterium]